jgi:hypothetical protein
MLVPHAVSRTEPPRRSISAARPSFGSSRTLSEDGMSHGRLRGIPVKMAHHLSGLDLAARQRHSLKNPLVPECRILILPFHHAGALAGILLVSVPVLFNHKNV